MPAAGLLRDVPLAALAGVLLFVATRIFHLGELEAIARFDPFELALALVTLLAVALIGVEQGIGVAVGLAILDRTRLTARPQLHVLGRIPGTTSWAPVTAPERPVEVPGVLVVLFAAPLWYANATHFRAGLDHARRAVGAGAAARRARRAGHVRRRLHRLTGAVAGPSTRSAGTASPSPSPAPATTSSRTWHAPACSSASAPTTSTPR